VLDFYLWGKLHRPLGHESKYIARHVIPPSRSLAVASETAASGSRTIRHTDITTPSTPKLPSPLGVPADGLQQLADPRGRFEA
jgi:hypothetical protein